MNYCNTISGEIQSKEDWMIEIISEEYHLQSDIEVTPDQYWQDCLDNGSLVKVDLPTGEQLNAILERRWKPLEDNDGYFYREFTVKHWSTIL